MSNGDKSHLFKPGHVPSSYQGRAAPAVSLARAVREMTDDGRVLIEVLAEILVDPDASRRDRTEAAKVLLDRGFGAPLRTELQIQAQASDAHALEALADGELARLADMLSGKRDAPNAPRAPSLEAMASADILPEYRSLPPQGVTDTSVTVTPPPLGDLADISAENEPEK